MWKRLLEVAKDIFDLRRQVKSQDGTAGCTHLNDAMRALAEVPTLVDYLRPQVERQSAAGRGWQGGGN